MNMSKQDYQKYVQSKAQKSPIVKDTLCAFVIGGGICVIGQAIMNLALAQGTVPETVREHYALLEHHAGECIGCWACESRCPFEVSIVENMARAEKIFGK